MATVVG